MCTTTDNGRNIKRIWWYGANGDTSITASDSVSLVFAATYHGDRDEFWIVQSIDGKETARHNARFIASIEWAI